MEKREDALHSSEWSNKFSLSVAIDEFILLKIHIKGIRKVSNYVAKVQTIIKSG